MIIANSRPFAGGFQLELVYPDNQPSQFAQVASEAEGLRLVYIHRRQYVTPNLIGGLKQRMYALQSKNERRVTVEAARLSVLLGVHSQASIKGICRLVAEHRKAIESVAPSERSDFYGHYERVILPIITYCENYQE